MKRTCILVVTMFLLSSLPDTAQSAFPVTHIPTIQVSGEGSQTVEPDRAGLSMRVSEIRPSVTDAKTEVDQKAMQIQDMLIDLGIAKNDINASQVLIQEVDRDPSPQGTPQTGGYRVSRQITVTIMNIAQLDTVLDRSVALGTNEIWQVELYSSREAELKRDAMRLAVSDARRKAEILAAEVGRSLGNVYMAEYEFDSGYRPVYRMAMQDRGGAVEFSRGTMRISAQVAVVYELR